MSSELDRKIMVAMVDELDSEKAGRIRDDLRRAWTGMFGEVGELKDDLRWLAPFFGPRAAPKHLRRRVAALPQLTVDGRTLEFEPPLLLSAGVSYVVTPEGRLVLEELLDGQPLPDQVSLDRDPRLTRLYRSWSQERLRDLHSDLMGESEPMYAVAVAAVLILLLHGADDEETALVIPPNLSKEVKDALRSPLEAFANLASIKTRPGRKTAFEAYPIGQAKRRLGSALQRSPETGRPMSLYLRADARGDVLEAVAQAFASRDMTPEQAHDAISVLVRAYDEAYPRLVEAGLGRKRDIDRTALLRELRAHLPA